MRHADVISPHWTRLWYTILLASALALVLGVAAYFTYGDAWPEEGCERGTQQDGRPSECQR